MPHRQTIFFDARDCPKCRPRPMGLFVILKTSYFDVPHFGDQSQSFFMISDMFRMMARFGGKFGANLASVWVHERLILGSMLKAVSVYEMKLPFSSTSGPFLMSTWHPHLLYIRFISGFPWTNQGFMKLLVLASKHKLVSDIIHGHWGADLAAIWSILGVIWGLLEFAETIAWYLCWD